MKKSGVWEGGNVGGREGRMVGAGQGEKAVLKDGGEVREG